MDKLSIAKEGLGQREYFEISGGSATASSEGDTPTALAFVSDILKLLRQSLSSMEEVRHHGQQGQGMMPAVGRISLTIADVPESVSKVWEQKAVSVEDFIEDWEWRLVVLQHLRPSSQYQLQWKETLTILRASPSTLLNM